MVRGRGHRAHPVVEPPQLMANDLRDGAAHVLGPHGDAHGPLPAGRVRAALYSPLPRAGGTFRLRRTWDKLGYFPTNQQVKWARLIVADLDEPISRFRMSKSVTSRTVFAE